MNAIPLDPSEPTIQTPPRLASEDAALVCQMAGRSTGDLQIEQMPAMPDQYLLVKRSPNKDAAKYDLALIIDAAALI